MAFEEKTGTLPAGEQAPANWASGPPKRLSLPHSYRNATTGSTRVARRAGR